MVGWWSLLRPASARGGSGGDSIAAWPRPRTPSSPEVPASSAGRSSGGSSPTAGPSRHWPGAPPPPRPSGPTAPSRSAATSTTSTRSGTGWRAPTSPSTRPPTSATGATRPPSSASTSRAPATSSTRPGGPACGGSCTSAPRRRCSAASRSSSPTSARRWPSARPPCTARRRPARRRSCSGGPRRAADGRRAAAVRVGRGDTTILPPVMTEMVRAGRFAWIGGGRQRTSTSHVDNVVEGLCSPPRAGRAAACTSSPTATGGRLPRVRHRAAGHPGRRPPDRSVPLPVARPLAGAAERAWRHLRLPGRPPVTRFSVWVSALECTLSDARGRRELGYAPIVTHEEGLARLVPSAA